MGTDAVNTDLPSAFVSFSSVAKINRFLHITGQRSDGYHLLQTVFQFLDFGDSMAFRVTANPEIELLTPITGVSHDSNLIVKAAKALQQHSQCQFGAQIKIDKQLPMGGGLGGGSSNAATTLLALNSLWQLNLSLDTLADIGIKLGADVPVFIRGFNAFAEGVGEKLTPIDIDCPWFLVSIPNCSISTAAIFTHKDLPRNTTKVQQKNLNIDQCHNDCEKLVIKLYPEVAKLMNWLLEYAPSRLTGTGACIFSTFADEKSARDVQSKLPQGVNSFVAKGLVQSPIIDELHQVSEQNKASK